VATVIDHQETSSLGFYFVSIDFQELRELLGTISQTDITELTLKSDDFELTVRKGGIVVSAPASINNPVPISSVTPTIEVTATTAPAQTTVVTATTDITPAAPKSDKKWVEVTSPMVGTFYRAPAPDEPPFVSVGDRLNKGQVVCIIEAMKLMNEIEAEISGQVMEILVQNGEPIEYGQTLMLVNPQ
jgi:acetyl-CoA carboxylase biotin carboxyl carrier protein